MSDVERMTVTLTTDMAAVIKGAVSAGEYASSSEIVREALRHWQHEREVRSTELKALRALVQEGLDDVKAGRVHAFDAEKIAEKGRQRFLSNAPSE